MTKSKFYTVGITGAGGLVGTALRDELLSKEKVNGKPVRIVRLSRGSGEDPATVADAEALSTTTISWNPSASIKDEILPACEELDAVVHLAGENIATGSGPLGFLGIQPWSDAKKQEILDSRVKSSEALSKVLQKDQVFLAASGVGAYGNNFIGDSRDAVDESLDISESDGFLAEVSRQAEAASRGSPARLVNMRFGVVLSQKAGALAKLAPIFFLGGGGNVGSGQQYFAFISARDIARAVVHMLETPSLSGPVNVCAPNPCTNEEFTKALGAQLNRPTILPFPGFAVSALFGEMGEETLLGGVRALPTKLVKSGFVFSHATVEDAVKSAFEEKDI